MHLPAAEPHSTTGFLFQSQYLSGTIWLTPYSMVWDWRVSREGPMPFHWPSCSLLFCLQLFCLSLFFLCRLVVWGWGLWTDRVSISLSGLALPIFFNNNNNNIINNIALICTFFYFIDVSSEVWRLKLQCIFEM